MVILDTHLRLIKLGKRLVKMMYSQTRGEMGQLYVLIAAFYTNYTKTNWKRQLKIIQM